MEETFAAMDRMFAEAMSEMDGVMKKVDAELDDLKRKVENGEVKVRNFVIKDGKLLTHPADHHILPGIGRAHLIKAAKAIEEFNPDAIIYIYKAGKVNLDSLPEEVVSKVNEILDYFTKAYVTYMNGKFEVSACIGIQKNYPVDYFFCGIYTK